MIDKLGAMFPIYNSVLGLQRRISQGVALRLLVSLDFFLPPGLFLFFNLVETYWVIILLNNLLYRKPSFLVTTQGNT